MFEAREPGGMGLASANSNESQQINRHDGNRVKKSSCFSCSDVDIHVASHCSERIEETSAC